VSTDIRTGTELLRVSSPFNGGVVYASCAATKTASGGRFTRDTAQPPCRKGRIWLTPARNTTDTRTNTVQAAVTSACVMTVTSITCTMGTCTVRMVIMWTNTQSARAARTSRRARQRTPAVDTTRTMFIRQRADMNEYRTTVMLIISWAIICIIRMEVTATITAV